VRKVYILPLLSPQGKLSKTFTITNANHHGFHPSSVGTPVNPDPYTVIYSSDAHHRLHTIGWYVHYYTMRCGNT
jgi:hypothetical protein